LPGFVEGFVYESTDGGSRHNVVTTAVWKDADAYQNAKKSAAEEFERIGFNPPEIMKKLKVEIERGSLPSLPVLTSALIPKVR
jgi:heme-degrading monooxygenase HmoA